MKILIIVTAHTVLGGTGSQTGLWFEELSTPYYAFVDRGAEVTIASLPGGIVPIDPHSLGSNGENPTSVERFLKDEAAMTQVQNAHKLSDLDYADYDVIFIPGGHGAMWDLADSEDLGVLLSKAWADGKILASVCHGPAGLLRAREVDGAPLLAGKRVSAFSDAEENAMHLEKVVPFLLESKIRELGANYESGSNFKSFAVRDGRLVTGQNPASSEKVAEYIFEAIGEKAAKASK